MGYLHVFRINKVKSRPKSYHQCFTSRKTFKSSHGINQRVMKPQNFFPRVVASGSQCEVRFIIIIERAMNVIRELERVRRICSKLINA